MRKFKFKQVQNYIELFKKIGEGIYVELNDKKGTVEKACEYLELCQQKAIDLGTYIENEEGEGHPTVSQLEAFCEVLYEIHEDVQSEHGLSADSAKNRINTCVNRIENSAKTDIKITNLAVFLPYKASMWDSLESVWQAADEDPDCETYVIPIPYYDKTPQNKLGKVHWEADLFPDYVPITRFDEFDFAAAHPDMIFIHNPYDYANLVTSVHPAFYSDKLKEFTDCLVYIPYFCTSGAMSEGFKLLPAYLNADYIIVQSEQLIDYYDPIIPREKILPLGSPKFDSVIRKCQNPPEPPAEWKAKMEGKKVYFLNMSLKAMLGNTVQFLQKLNYVLECFKDSDKACLLWRPHPLMESTFDSMRPGYKQAYIDMRDRFIAEDWGIYDTTPNIEDSISWSDVYIGDGASSVVSMFDAAGKDTFMMGINCFDESDDEAWMKTIYQTNCQNWKYKKFNKYFIFRQKSLFYSPEDDMNFKYLMDIPAHSEDDLFSRAVEYKKDKIYILPRRAPYFLLIESENKMNRIDFKDADRFTSFGAFWINDNYVFIFPQNYKYLVRLNMEDCSIDYIEGLKEYNMLIQNNNVFSAPKWIADNNLYICKGDNSEILVIDCKTLIMNTIKTDFNGNYIHACREKNKNICWFIPNEGTVVQKFNFDTKTSQEVDLKIDGLVSTDRELHRVSNKNYFGNAVKINNKMVFSPNWGNKFIQVDSNTNEVEEWKNPFNASEEKQEKYINNNGIGYFSSCEDENQFYYFHRPTNQTFFINSQTGEIRELRQTFDKEDVKNVLCRDEKKPNGGIKREESVFYPLHKYLMDNGNTSSEKCLEKHSNDLERSVGRTVYETLKEGN